MGKPFQKVYSPANEDADGIADDATGAATTITLLATSAGDGLAHKLTFASSANLSGVNLTITGTDADGVAQTEVIAGPNNNTVTTTAYFKTWSSIAKSATFGANTLDAGWADEFVTPTIPLDHRASKAGVMITPGGTIDYTGQKTYTQMSSPPFVFSDIEDPLGNIDIADITDAVEFAMDPVPSGMRLQANSYSSGASLTLNINHAYH